MCRVSAAVSLSSTATRRWTRCGFTSVTAQQQSAAANSTLSTLHPDFQRLPSVDYDPVMYDAGARTGPAQIMGNASVGMATLRRCARPTATILDHNIKTPLRPSCLIDGVHSGRCIGRDGFASIETAVGSAAGEVHTHSIIFTGKHFFVNVGLRSADTAHGAVAAGASTGSVTVQLKNRTTNQPIAPFTTA